MNPKIIDFDSVAVVVTVESDGSYSAKANICNSLAAELLHGIADRLRAEHPPYPCDEPDPQHERPRDVEPADPRGGRLDRNRRVYVDPRGHAWDLSLKWGDIDDRVWTWHGSTDGLGEPILRTVDDEETQPLGVLLALYGPISPLSGGAA